MCMFVTKQTFAAHVFTRACLFATVRDMYYLLYAYKITKPFDRWPSSVNHTVVMDSKDMNTSVEFRPILDHKRNLRNLS